MACRLYCLLDWKDEDKSSVYSLTKIWSPRLEFEEYKVGQQVQAKYKDKLYNATIAAISESSKFLKDVAEGKSLLEENVTSKNLEPKPRGPTERKLSATVVDENAVIAEKRVNKKRPVADEPIVEKLMKKMKTFQAEDGVQKETTTDPGSNGTNHIEATSSKEITTAVNDKVVAEMGLKTNRMSRELPVSRDEFRALKDEVQRLRNRVRDLEGRKSAPAPIPTSPKPRTSFQMKCAASTSPTPVISTDPVSAPVVIASPDTENNGPGLYNGHTASELHDSIAHCDKLYDATKILALKLFPISYILDHSISGKPSNSKTPPKPMFDSRLYGILVITLKAKFIHINQKDITEKMHSVQKCFKNHDKK